MMALTRTAIIEFARELGYPATFGEHLADESLPGLELLYAVDVDARRVLDVAQDRRLAAQLERQRERRRRQRHTSAVRSRPDGKG